MLTRCPTCQTTFRVTPDQLQVKAGRVRCGQCQHIFNALDHLEADPADETILVAPPPLDLAPPAPAPVPAPVAPTPAEAPAPEALLSPLDADTAPERLPLEVDKPPPPPPPSWTADDATLLVTPDGEPANEPDLAPSVTWDPAAETILEPRVDKGSPAPLPAESVSTPISETPALEASTGAEFEDGALDAPHPAGDSEPAMADEASTDEAAPLAPLTPAIALDPHDPILARDHTEIPGYSKWAQAPLASGGVGLSAAPRRPTWPFTLAATLLVLALAGQAALYWRTELCTAAPFLRGLFATLGVDVPLPRITEKVSLEASDLQSDASRGLLVLQATLRNRAAFPQAYPSLDLALTDVADSVVLRRTLAPADYLPEGAPPAFAPGADLAVKVWLDIKPQEAAGYRLVVFYP